MPDKETNAEIVDKLEAKNIETIVPTRNKPVENVMDEIIMRGYVDHKISFRNKRSQLVTFKTRTL